MDETRNATIRSVFLGREDHGIPTCFVALDYGGSGQSFGGYDLRVYGIDMVLAIIDAVGAMSWEDLVGRNCRVRCTGRELTGIGHIMEDRWYSPKK